MGILDKEIKRMKAEDERLIRLLSVSGHLAVVGYDLSDDGNFFSASLMISLPDGKIYLDNRQLMTIESYASIKDKEFIDRMVASGEVVIVDGLGNPLKKEWKQELIEQINKYNMGGMWVNEK